jgi:hypothetical protein
MQVWRFAKDSRQSRMTSELELLTDIESALYVLKNVSGRWYSSAIRRLPNKIDHDLAQHYWLNVHSQYAHPAPNCSSCPYMSASRLPKAFGPVRASILHRKNCNNKKRDLPSSTSS